MILKYAGEGINQMTQQEPPPHGQDTDNYRTSQFKYPDKGFREKPKVIFSIYPKSSDNANHYIYDSANRKDRLDVSLFNHAATPEEVELEYIAIGKIPE